MGCGNSKAANVVPRESPLSEALERKLVHAVVSTKRRKSFVVKKSSFNNLMLQLPKLTLGFKKIREAHAKAVHPTGKVTWGALRTICGQELGLNPDSDSLKEVLDMPEVADTVLVTHADLIIIFTVIFLIDGSTKCKTILSPEVLSCLELMEKSFMFFDSSADGCIERKELAMAMKSGTRVFGRKASKTLADRLFDQLDWSKDGAITFKEYLVGMERIIIETAGEDDDEEIDMTDEDEELRDLEKWEDDGSSRTAPQQQTSSSSSGGTGLPERSQAEGPPKSGEHGAVAGKDEAVKIDSTADEVRPFTLNGMDAVPTQS